MGKFSSNPIATGLKPRSVPLLLLSSALLSATLLSSTAAAQEQNWTRFLGANGRASVTSVDVPLEWDANTNIQWKTAIPGPGSSSPVVVQDQVFLTCYTGYGVEPVEDPKASDTKAGNIEALTRHLLCLNRHTGEIVWRKSIDNSSVKNEDPYKGYITYHGYATNTPLTDGKWVYAFFGKAGLVAFDLQGNEKWRRTFEGEPNQMRWGSAASPIFYQDQLIINAIDEYGKILSLNKTNGEINWEFDAQSRMAYSTPGLITTAEGKTELVLAVPQKVYGLDPNTGEQKWFASTTLENEVNASIIVEDDIAYIYGGYQAVGSLAVRAGGSGDVTDSHVLWTSRDTSYVSTPVMKDEHLYWINKSGIAYCVDAATGEQKYKARVPALTGGRGVKMFASMVLVGDNILSVSRTAGTTVWKANPEEFQLVGQNRIEGDDSPFNGTPAIDGGQLFLRSNRFLYCISDGK